MPSTPLASPILRVLEELHQRLTLPNDGEVATYIPELARANPDWFGICVATATGGIYEVGDTAQPFTIQSISKPLIYGLALEEHGRADVFRRMGVEPTGDAFNSISLDPGTGRPKNPMINAGAIAATSMIQGRTPKKRFERILSTLSLYAGRDLTVDESVYRSESETGHRNRAIGHMLRNFGILESDPTPALELYFRQCAISVTCRDLGLMAATLANRGINPATGKQAVRGEYVESILSVMSSSGMYDYAGEWIYRIGMPAKSGVGGGIIAVLPGQLGIAVFSPRLDARGNSARGIRVCDALSRHLDLHLFNHPRATKSVIRSTFDASQITSSLARTPRETAVLQAQGQRIRTYQLQGYLTFATGETLVAEIMRGIDELQTVILDLRRVVDVNESACLQLADLVDVLSASGRHVLFSHPSPFPQLRRILRLKLAARAETRFEFFTENDTASEWAENQLLLQYLPERVMAPRATPAEFHVLAGLTARQVALVESQLDYCSFDAGAIVVEAGAPADCLFFVVQGQASATLRLDSGEIKRLAAFGAGMVFGEMAVLERSSRSATVTATTALECARLSTDALDHLSVTHPAIKLRLLENLCRGLSLKLRKANCERAVFEE